jgi:sugar (pentulose or hexulose) kinase
MKLFLGIDMGTSYFKAGLFDENGGLQGLGRQAVKTNAGKPGIYELTVETFWATIYSCIIEATTMAKAKIDDIIALSYSSQANSFLLLDKDFEPLTPIILWPDLRAKDSAPVATGISNHNDWAFKTGLGINLSHHSCMAKLMWIRTRQPVLWNSIGAVMTISDYFTFGLTGQRAADGSTASLLGILEIEKCTWWTPALESLEVDRSWLSAPYRTGDFTAKLSIAGALKIGLNPGTAFSIGGLDHHVAGIGAGLLNSNYISESTGTVLAAVQQTNEYVPKANTCLAPALYKNQFFRMAFDDNGAGSLEWYQKNYADDFNIQSLLQMASDIPIGSEGLIARPAVASYKSLEGFENMQPFHEHGHFVRAILESTALSLERILQKLTTLNNSPAIVATGGGAMSKLWIKIKADLIGKKFLVPRCSETACLGAAMIGAAGTDMFHGLHEITQHWVRFDEEVEPGTDEHRMYSEWSYKLIDAY